MKRRPPRSVRRLHARGFPVLPRCGDRLDQSCGSLPRRRLRRHRSIVIGVLLQRRRHGADEFHERTNLADIEEADLDLALGDLLLAGIEAETLIFGLIASITPAFVKMLWVRMPLPLGIAVSVMAIEISAFLNASGVEMSGGVASLRIAMPMPPRATLTRVSAFTPP